MHGGSLWRRASHGLKFCTCFSLCRDLNETPYQRIPVVMIVGIVRAALPGEFRRAAWLAAKAKAEGKR